MEYITEWPPLEDQESFSGVKRKRDGEATSIEELRMKEGKHHAMRTVQRERHQSTDETKLAKSSPLVPVTTVLAQWWKLSAQKNICQSHHVQPSSHSPNTLLYHIAKLVRHLKLPVYNYSGVV